MARSAWLLAFAAALSGIAPAHAFFFFFDWPAETSACDVVNLTWRSADPPFQAVIVPMYSQPFVYDIPDSAYDGNRGSYPISLQMPVDTNYVVYMSDGHGRFTGGSSLIQAIQASNNTACLATKSTNQSTLDFTFTVSGQAKQCEAGFETSWTGGQEDGPYNMTVVPLDKSFYPFDVPLDETLRHQSSWVMNITKGSRFTLSMNNKKGYGHGGTAGVYEVSDGPSNDCIVSPVAPPASWPVAIGTNTLGSATLPITSAAATASSSASPRPESDSSGLSAGGIAGLAIGVIAGVALIALLLFFLWRRRRRQRESLPTERTDAFDVDPDSHAMIEPYRPLSYPAPGSGLLAEQQETSQRDSMGTFTSAGFAGLGAPSPRPSVYSDGVVSPSARPLPAKNQSPSAPRLSIPSPPSLKAAEASGSFNSTSSANSRANLIDHSPQHRGGLQITNHDAADEAVLPALPPGAVHGNGSGEGRRRSRQTQANSGGFRRHADAGRLDGGENAPVERGEIIDLPPMYQEVPREP